MTEALGRPELDINVLSGQPAKRVRGEHGWYTGGTHNYDWLLKHREIKDWIDSYTSKQTRKAKLYQFQKVLHAAGFKDPAQLLNLSDLEAKNLVKRVAQYYLQNGKPSWARGIMITMRGFYEAHDRELRFKRTEKIRTPAKKKIGIEYIPSRPDAYRMVDSALSPRNKALILCLFQSGVRVGCLCKWTYGMVEDQLYPEVHSPVQIKVTQELDSKLAGYGLGYYVTFLSEEAAQGLREYLEQRKRDGWKPKPSDRVFVTESSASQGRPMNPIGVWEIVKSTAELAGLKPEGIWTHVLRKTFLKVLNDTPAIPEDMKEALMGHKLPGSRGSYFDYHDLEDVAEKYSQANWSRNGGNVRVSQLEKENLELVKRMVEMEKRIDGIEQDRRKR